MLQSVSLSALQPAAANPRRKIDRKAIEGLAASIKTDGVLHKEAEPRAHTGSLRNRPGPSLANSASRSRKGSRFGAASRRPSRKNSLCTKRCVACPITTSRDCRLC